MDVDEKTKFDIAPNNSTARPIIVDIKIIEYILFSTDLMRSFEKYIMAIKLA